MSSRDCISGQLRGIYRDVMKDGTGRMKWDRGWQQNTIVTDCRRLLASFMKREPTSTGIQGIRVGAGDDRWDTSTPPTDDDRVNRSTLVSSTQLITDFEINFLSGDAPSAAPTNRIRIFAQIIGVAGTLREFGLVGSLNGTEVLINYVIHPRIVLDAGSTLERTIWLDF